MARNVTEQRRREQEARRLATIVESSEDAIVATDLDATITHSNRGAERLFGDPVGEAVGRSDAMLLIADELPDELPDGMASWRRVRSGEALASLTARRVRRDGTVIDVSVSLSPIRDAHGAVVGVGHRARHRAAGARRTRSLRPREARRAP